MFAGRMDRIWALGGILVAAILLVVGWFFLISPQLAETDRLQGETETAHVRAATLQSRLSQLKRENADLPRYRAELEAARQALPTTAESEQFLRQLQTAGEATGVDVGTVAVGAPAVVEAAGVKMHSLPVALTATGGTVALDEFLDQLQQVQPRAALIDDVTVQEGGEEADSKTGLNVNLKIFVAPPAVK
ncbi:type 4a pilus biogenesis protein PilO [Planobispora siamensis]|uniref:Type IV pilus assembly protein PilO n=1 Tax=Planobispora siamensis TaxID=936338 RepID=A0A8J3SBY3_9ACTN|nr:type 4a pilus biogenesis protein PilO [Planobispora siamensis]GIH89967.1 hypothetical protein Psi01_05970 [Planobispora siamensis]